MKKHYLTSAVVLTLAASFVAEVAAQGSSNFLVTTRKAAMSLQAKYFGGIFGMVQPGGTYDAARAKRNADYLLTMTQLAWDDFQPATIGNANTRAKEDIYKDMAKFNAAADALQGEVKKLAAAAQAGDQAAVTASAKKVATSCNGCHETFTTYQFRFKVD